jgi:4'-phosphopantetheinyl transferase EntD
MRGLLPAAVEVVVLDARSEAALTDAERESLAASVEQDGLEFGEVRWCALTALARLGLAPVALVPGPGGVPWWLQGVVGSLTHCAGYRAAAVTSTESILALGIDAVPADASLTAQARAALVTAGERATLAELAAADPALDWTRVLLSMKETVAKCWFPLTNTRLDAEQIEVVPSLEGTFRFRLETVGRPDVAGLVSEQSGRWSIDGDFVLTALVVGSE